MGFPFAYYDLLDAFAKPGCAVCALLLRDAAQFLDKLLYEFVNDRQMQRAFRASYGLCNPHSWQLTGYRGGALGAAILHAAVLGDIQAKMDRFAPASAALTGISRLFRADAPGEALARALEPQAACMACERLAVAESDAISTLAQVIHLPDVQSAYQASEGLCLPHFRQLLRQVSSPSDLKAVISFQAAIWSKLEAEIAEFQRKSDAHYGDETIDADEATSWLRAVGQVAGAKGALPGTRRP